MWLELALVVPRTELATVSAALFAAGSAGVQEDFLPGETPAPRQPWDDGPPPPLADRQLLRAWFEDPDVPALTARFGTWDPTWTTTPDTDWSEAWKTHFRAVRISDRLVIGPPWDAPEGALVLEPGQGFGTGTHPTTRGALLQLDALADDVTSVLDVGCGSGVLALAAAKLGLTARGVDIDAAGVAEGLRTAKANGLSIDLSTTPVADLSVPAELVLANLHAELIVRLAPDLMRLTSRWLVLAGVLADREALVQRAIPWPRADRVVDGEWVCLRLRRP